MRGQLKSNPIDIFPERVKGEDFSKTVLVFDEDLEYFDIGYYDFNSDNWQIFGDLQMNIISWSEVPLPHELQIKGFKTYLTEL